jgi:molecular chaperone GrpE
MSTEEKQDSPDKSNASSLVDAFKQQENELGNLDKELDLVNEKDNAIAKLTEENKQLKDKFLRTVAELENVRRIAADEKEKMSKYAISSFASSLIPVMENFFLAFKNVEVGKIEKVFFEGINLTFSELKKVFEKYNLKRICPEEEKFNPEIHQAITQVESKKEENTIVEVAQAGYILNDRVLKPALVIVSKGKK